MSEKSGCIPSSIRNLVEILQWRALNQPDTLAYTFLPNGETGEFSLTYEELDRQARKIGGLLQSLGAAGKRVLLLCPPSLDYVGAFMGCLYASAAPVPAYPPRFNRNLIRLQATVDDAQATIALTTASIRSLVERNIEHAPSLKGLRWLTLEDVSGDLGNGYRDVSLTDDALAFLQYTSGSTSAPKGVMISHGNLYRNSVLIQEAFETKADSECVIWLPPYHDMGLIGGILQPLFAGFHTTLMPPMAFFQRPFRWLQTISKTHGTISGGPNFAYDLCAQKVTPEQVATLDLSRWDTAFTGAEPIRPETLERFTETFAPCGFRREAFYPCYGLAEATLLVSGGTKATPPVVAHFDSAALELKRAVETFTACENTRALVCCGSTLQGQQLVIADPDLLVKCRPGQVGEIWVAGPSIAQGYLNQPEQTVQTFKAYLADTGAGPFLRTGDLGFLREGELFVTGRLKDLIIICGQNHYPQDIEKTVQRSHPALRADCGAVFVVEDSREQRLIVVQEVERSCRNLDPKEAVATIRCAISEVHGLRASSVVLIKAGSIPKTTSGKIQRNVCRDEFLNGSLNSMLSAAFTGLIADASSRRAGYLRPQ